MSKNLHYSLKQYILCSALLICAAQNASAEPDTQPAPQAELIPTVNLVPVNYRHRLVQQLSLAEDNQNQWLQAINDAKPDQREAFAYLVINMPDQDIKDLKPKFIADDVELAYKARAASQWASQIPKEIFFNEVLPYVNMDEAREDWRTGYFNRFMPLVKNAKSASEAEQILNKQVFPMVKVKYHATKRLKPNQSPAESEKIGYASCTGLSIILADACRACGVPARVAGTSLWSDGSGNHTWTEIWDHQWYYVGSAEPGPLNQTWFSENASKADDSKPDNRIYAASFEQTPLSFPLVWDTAQLMVKAQDVTGYYVARQTMLLTLPPQTHAEIRHRGTLVAESSDPTRKFQLPVGQQYSIALLDQDGKVISTKSIKLESTSQASVNFVQGG